MLASAPVRVAFVPVTKAPSARTARSVPARQAVICSAQPGNGQVDRRQLLQSVAGAALLSQVVVPSPSAAVEYGIIEIKNLNTFQKKDQRAAYQAAAEAALRKVVGSSDATAAMRLALNDAATYDISTGTGGFDGSIVLPEELSRPGNAGLEALVAKLKEVKAEIDASGDNNGQGPISWADLIYLTGKVAISKQWRESKLGIAATESGGSIIADNFKAEWPVVLGRKDASEPAPAGRTVPGPDASIEEVKSFFLSLANKGESGPFAGKPPFGERQTFLLWTAAQPDPAAAEAKLAADPDFAAWKKKYDRSRKTVTRTEFEVDFIEFYNKLTGPVTGTKFSPDAYLAPLKYEKKRL